MENLCLRVCMLIFLVQYSTGFSNLLNKNTTTNQLCLEEERQLLLQLKQQLSPYSPEYYYKTKYWKGSRDCCMWDGVTCDYFTRHVIALDLSYSNHNSTDTFFTGKLKSNSSLFHLGHLRELNLAHNDFLGSPLPPEFGRLDALTHLNLSTARFGGEMPTEFYHLSNLLSLDLSTYDPYTEDLIRCDVKMLFGNMTGLRALLLSNQDLSNSELPTNMSSFLTHLDLANTGLRGNLPATIFEKPSLRFLNLSLNGGIEGSLPKTLNWSNVHSINVLDLKWTGLSGRLPDSIGLMSHLSHMDLSNCSFSGPIPESIGNITDIASINWSFNQFSGEVPSTVSTLTHLTHLHLSHNRLEGQLPSSLTNMSRLEYLDMSSNLLTGPLPTKQAGHGLQHLRELYLFNNSIQGTIPPWLFTLPSLETLDLFSNRLTGRIGKLNSSETLKVLDLRSNRLIIEFQSFYNLTSIESISVSYNTVIEDGVNVTFPNLYVLRMSSCGINKFPNFLQRSMSTLIYLNLSNNNIHGPIPSWFTSNSLQGTFPSSICNNTQLEVLDLRGNEFNGKIPTTIGDVPYLVYLGLNGNHFEGPLPPSLANCTSLEVIDLGNNMLRDTFPWWLHSLPNLKILILRANSFHGSITSPHFTHNSFPNLQIFDLSHNNFTGLLPEHLFATLKAIKYQTQALQRGDDLYMRTFMYEYSVKLSVKGAYLELTKVLKVFTTIDLSSNNFNSTIPKSLSSLTSLRLLNLSHNNIHGSIPPVLGCMINLEQLDLSSNQLTGGIPETLTNLTFLGNLNLSHNHLVGPVPQGNQFPTFSNESYIGNSGLCGAPLTRSCGDERDPPLAGDFEEDEDGLMMGFTWKVVVIGYGCGIVLGFILGNVLISMKKPRCLARFVYVEAAIILRRRRRNKRRRVVQGPR